MIILSFWFLSADCAYLDLMMFICLINLGGRSIRGLYTSALAQVLSESKEKQELRGLHSAAVRKIKKHIDYSAYEQIPEYRDTFDKTLYIGGNKSNPK